jgi:hypothetical protein
VAKLLRATRHSNKRESLVKRPKAIGVLLKRLLTNAFVGLWNRTLMGRGDGVPA